MCQGFSRPVFLGVSVLAGLAIAGCSSSGNSRPGGTGGTSATGGSSSGGTTGTGGASTGTGGAAGAPPLPCTANPTISLISNFGTAAGDGGATVTGMWGTTGQITGSVFGYPGTKTNDAGMMSKISATIDRTMGTLTLAGTVVAADYAGGGMAFSTCVDTTNWTGIQFTLGGTADGCNITFQLQTESQEPTSMKGTCTSSSCYDFPQIQVTIPATAGTPTVIHFSDLTATGMPSAPADFEKEMFGLQWQFTSAAPPDGGVQAGCSPDMTISDVMWTSN